MKIAREKSENSGSFELPLYFVRECMTRLDGHALKLYLWLLAAAAAGREALEEAELAAALSLSGNEVADALSCLVAGGLIALDEDGLVLTDLWAIERENKRTLQGRISPLLAVDPELRQRREAVIRQISDTFFQGLMPSYFYREIDRWFEQYKFDPDVVYALFQEAKQYNKLGSSSYAASIAANWAANGVHSFTELSRYFDRYNRLKSVAERVRKKLRLRSELNEYQLELIDRWTNEWAFSFEIIDEALRRGSLRSSANLQYIDRILQEWKNAELSSLAEVQDFEQKRSQRFRELGGRSSGSFAAGTAPKGPAANFEQRRYEKSEIEQLYSFSAEPPENSAAAESLQSDLADGTAQNASEGLR